MMPWHEEGMEGVAHVRASARVIEFPAHAIAAREAGAAPATPGARRPAGTREPAAPTIAEIARSNVMRSLITIIVFAAAAIATLFATSAASANEPPGSHVSVSVLGGYNSFSKNDTALPDNLNGVPFAAGIAYRLSPNFAAEGEFTWFVPMKQSVDMGNGVTQDRKAPNSLAYQAGLRASLPLTTWTPYLTGGLGAITFLSDTSPDRLPRLEESQTVFAVSFGGGAQYPVGPRWGLRADFREFVGFPGNDAAGLSSNGNADAIWLARGTVGVDYRF